MGEHRLCKPEVTGSIPVISTKVVILTELSGFPRLLFDN